MFLLLYQSRAAEPRGRGHLPPPPPKKIYLTPKSALFKVKSAPFLSKDSLNALFAPDGAEKAQSGQGVNLYALMRHLAFHIRALIATAEPGNCPRESFSLPLKGHSPGCWNQGAGGACSPKLKKKKKVPFFLKLIV